MDINYNFQSNNMQIRHLLFDMDNTLYPASSAMNQGITSRMNQFVADFVGISLEEACELRKLGVAQYGTTLGWLHQKFGLTDIDVFFTAVHPESETAELEPDPSLRTFLESLQLPMTILTNAPRIHAERVLRFFNISDLFIGIHTIESNALRGKPHPEAYKTAIESSGYKIEETLFFDDHLKYIEGYARAGGTPIWIRPDTMTVPEHGKKYLHLESIYQIPEFLNHSSLFSA